MTILYFTRDEALRGESYTPAQIFLLMSSNDLFHLKVLISFQLFIIYKSTFFFILPNGRFVLLWFLRLWLQEWGDSNKTLVPLSLAFSGYGNYGAQGIEISSEISCQAKEKAEAWCQPRRTPSPRKRLHSSDNLSDNLAGDQSWDNDGSVTGGTSGWG